MVGARFAQSPGRRRARLTSVPPKPDQDTAPRSPRQPVPAAPAPVTEGDGAEPEEAERVDEADWDGSEESYGLVRPYSWTRGRTMARHELALEALISATGWSLEASAGPEHHAILRLCSTPRAVAEVAALLSVPLGVARVLVGDMAEAGSVVVHHTAGSGDDAPNHALMQRVLSCLQRL
ncbi:MAG: DUF742 domain-containing protein [Actinobacteria bacterium]|nr:DUF742 domain-containing protein [Actinomycetota bacterium]